MGSPDAVTGNVERHGPGFCHNERLETNQPVRSRERFHPADRCSSTRHGFQAVFAEKWQRKLRDAASDELNLFTLGSILAGCGEFAEFENFAAELLYVRRDMTDLPDTPFLMLMSFSPA